MSMLVLSVILFLIVFLPIIESNCLCNDGNILIESSLIIQSLPSSCQISCLWKFHTISVDKYLQITFRHIDTSFNQVTVIDGADGDNSEPMHHCYPEPGAICSSSGQYVNIKTVPKPGSLANESVEIGIEALNQSDRFVSDHDYTPIIIGVASTFMILITSAAIVILIVIVRRRMHRARRRRDTMQSCMIYAPTAPPLSTSRRESSATNASATNADSNQKISSTL